MLSNSRNWNKVAFTDVWRNNSTDLRLKGGKANHEGTVEIKYHGTWGTICNDQWDLDDANVICRQLGFAKAVSLSPGYPITPSAGTQPVITGLRCRGYEVSLGLCVFQSLEYVAHRCSHSKDAQVVCAHQGNNSKIL